MFTFGIVLVKKKKKLFGRHLKVPLKNKICIIRFKENRMAPTIFTKCRSKISKTSLSRLKLPSSIVRRLLGCSR